MPQKTIYVSDADLEIYKKAEEMSKKPMSSLIGDLIKDFVRKRENTAEIYAICKIDYTVSDVPNFQPCYFVKAPYGTNIEIIHQFVKEKNHNHLIIYPLKRGGHYEEDFQRALMSGEFDILEIYPEENEQNKTPLSPSVAIENTNKMDKSDLDILWHSVRELLFQKGKVSSFKGNALAKVVEITDNQIYLELEEKTSTKNNTVVIQKSDFAKALDLLQVRDNGVRQSDFDGNIARYLLGIMKSLPFFAEEIQQTIKNGKPKKTKFLVWEEAGQALLKSSKK